MATFTTKYPIQDQVKPEFGKICCSLYKYCYSFGMFSKFFPVYYGFMPVYRICIATIWLLTTENCKTKKNITIKLVKNTDTQKTLPPSSSKTNTNKTNTIQILQIIIIKHVSTPFERRNAVFSPPLSHLLHRCSVYGKTST